LQSLPRCTTGTVTMIRVDQRISRHAMGKVVTC
jgi:hypothetical protein